MILGRQKLFGNREDRFEGKKGEIRRSKFRRSPSYKKFGPWTVKLSENAYDEYLDLDDDSQAKVDKMMEELKTKPFQGNYGQHPLWEFYKLIKKTNKLQKLINEISSILQIKAYINVYDDRIKESGADFFTAIYNSFEDNNK